MRLKKTINIGICGILFAMGLFFFSSSVFAQTPPDSNTVNCEQVKASLYQVCIEQLGTAKASVCTKQAEDKFTQCTGEENSKGFVLPKTAIQKLDRLHLGGSGGIQNVQLFIGRLIGIGMGIIGSIALAMLVYAGFLWMTARGNSEKTTQAKNIMIWGALGVVVILSSYAIVQFLFEIV